MSTEHRNNTDSEEFQREEACSICGYMTPDWVDPEWAHGRVCLDCESNHERQAEHELKLAEFDAWNAMSEKERDDKIKWSLR